MSLFALLGLGLFSVVLSWALTKYMLGFLRRTGQFDIPNQRSSHSVPIPRGGGVAIIVTIFVISTIIFVIQGSGRDDIRDALSLSVLGLAFVSWRDDRVPLSWHLRLGAQVCAVALLLAVLPIGATLSRDIPYLLALALLAPTWLWVINLFNFMDGIDALFASQMIALSVGSALCLAFIGAEWTLIACALVLTGAMLGFLMLNWPPAQIFLGDVGSIPLGFLAGFIMLVLAGHGLWGVALALPAPFLADATLTLLVRLWRRERLTQAHRSHFYQRAAGLDRARHRAVVLRFIVASLLLIALSLSGLVIGGWQGQLLTLLGALIIASTLLWHLQQLARQTSS